MYIDYFPYLLLMGKRDFDRRARSDVDILLGDGVETFLFHANLVMPGG